MNAQTPDHPGVYVPPPIIYAAVFISAICLQHLFPLNKAFFQLSVTRYGSIVMFVIAFFFIFRSLGQFIRTKNTVMTIRPATSLLTDGIYKITRNPMYQGLVFVYLGLAGLVGNWWNIILLPLLILIIQLYVIKREENYLARQYGQTYTEYKKNVHRWL